MNAQEVAEILYYHYDEDSSRAFLEGIRYALGENESRSFIQEVNEWLHRMEKPGYEFRFMKK